MHTVAIQTCEDYSLERVSKALDELFAQLGMNPLNPFGEMIRPGMRVFIKPNWVASRWRVSCPHEDTIYCVITHPAVLEAIADRVAIALNGEGEITIGDNPSIDADFDELMELTQLKRLESKYDVPCHVVDLRPLICKDLKDYGIKHKMTPQRGDPKGEVEVNLGKDSMYYGMDASLFRGVFNEREETIKSHTGETQLYTLSKSIFDADAFISVPKMKTHHKVGVTLNLKGLVGNVSNKNQLVHWRIGTPETGGDEYPNLEAQEREKRAAVTKRGAHPGNDTIWRMVADLYRVMGMKKRSYFSVIDGIIAGEGEGPFCNISRKANTLVGGEDLLSCDFVAARLMGINPLEVCYLNHFALSGQINTGDIRVMENGECVPLFDSASPYLDFDVPEPWKSIKVR